MLDIVLGFFALILGIYYKIYRTIKSFAKALCTPFILLWEKIKDLSDDHLEVPYRLDRPFDSFNGFKSFLLFCLIAIFTVVTTVIRCATGDASTYLEGLMRSTALGTFFDCMQNGFNPTVPSLVAVAFGAVVFNMCYETLEDTPLYVRIPCFFLYFIMSANLALLLSGSFNTAGNWFIATATSVTEQLDQVQAITWKGVGLFLAAIPILYVLLLLLFMTLSKIMEALTMGIIGLIALFLIGFLMDWILSSTNASGQVYTIIEQSTLVIAIFGFEALRRPLFNWIDEFTE